MLAVVVYIMMYIDIVELVVGVARVDEAVRIRFYYFKVIPFEFQSRLLLWLYTRGVALVL